MATANMESRIGKTRKTSNMHIARHATVQTAHAHTTNAPVSTLNSRAFGYGYGYTDAESAVLATLHAKDCTALFPSAAEEDPRFPVADEPIPPPRWVVDNIVPELNTNASGNYEICSHDTTTTTTTGTSSKSEDGDSSRIRTCSKCHSSFPQMTLHPLPCGHSLCKPCILKCMKHTESRIADPVNRYRLDSILNQMVFLQQIHSRPHTGPGEKTRAETEYSRKKHLRDELAGLTCCEIPMHLERYSSCLHPDDALYYSEMLSWLATPASMRRVCAWPDCGFLIRQRAVYISERKEDYEAEVFYCLECGGNSIEGPDQRWQEDWRAFPWLTRGTRKLIPCR